MARTISCELEEFAPALVNMVVEVFDATDEKTGKAVEQSTRRGAKLLRGKYTEGIGKHPWSEKYRKGFTSHIEKGKVKTGEIGNKGKPGLVHLLEKGHATLTGRRTNAYPHMDPAWNDVSEDFQKRIGQAVDDALRG